MALENSEEEAWVRRSFHPSVFVSDTPRTAWTLFSPVHHLSEAQREHPAVSVEAEEVGSQRRVIVAVVLVISALCRLVDREI